MPVRRVVLIGFSGGGKSTVGRMLADRFGWTLADTDELIEREFGRSVPEIFARDGEDVFRAAERRIVRAALARDDVVIATGGGAVVDPALWADDGLGRVGTLVVALDVSPEVALRRLREQQQTQGGAVERPMLAGDDPLGRIAQLKADRLAVYDRAAVTLPSHHLTPEELVVEIAALTGGFEKDTAATVILRAPSGTSLIRIAPGCAEQVGAVLRATWPDARRVWIVTDDHVGPLHGERTASALTAAGFAPNLRAVAPGEGSKSLAGAGELYDWILGTGAERGDIAVALGGGMVGDLAGFVAATVLRGLRLAQMPTSLLAMVDSSVGGKTGINHAAGKNLIGAFYQPPLVLIDPLFLATLPPRELTSGWAEIIKHAVIQRSTPGGERGDLLPILERNRARLLAREEPALSYLITRNVALKTAVVEADEREAGGRALLNFGHTIGHAIEAAGYRYLHGEAVAIGMRGAMRIGLAMGTCTAEDMTRVNTLLDEFGLPQRAVADPERVIRLIGSDKKRASGQQRWILPLAGGGVEIRDDVPESVVREVLAEVLNDSGGNGS